MHEWVPIILSFCLGACWRLPGKRLVSIPLAAIGVTLIAATAFLISGEFNVSWAYFLLDFIQAGLGFFAGTAMARVLRNAPGMRKMK
jgi:hypothetical protein